MSEQISLCPRCGARAPFHTDNCGAWMDGQTTDSFPSPIKIQPLSDSEPNRDTWPDVYVTIETKELADLRSTITSLQSQLKASQLEAQFHSSNFDVQTANVNNLAGSCAELESKLTFMKHRLEAAEGENVAMRACIGLDQKERVVRGEPGALTILRHGNQISISPTNAVVEKLEMDWSAAESRAQQAEEMAGRAVEEKLGLVVDCERLATDLEQALRQWKMYAEERENEDLDKESHTEALSYRAAVKTAKDWRGKAFAITYPKLTSTSPPSDRTDGESGIALPVAEIDLRTGEIIESASLPVAENEGRVGA